MIGGCWNEAKIHTALTHHAGVRGTRGAGRMRRRLLRPGGAASAALWRGRLCAGAGIRLGGRILGLAWRKLVLGPGTLGASAKAACRLGPGALGADPSRLSNDPRPLAIGGPRQ